MMTMHNYIDDNYANIYIAHKYVKKNPRLTRTPQQEE